MNNSGSLDVSRILSKCLDDLGGQTFMTEWATENPTEFMQLYANVPLAQISSDADHPPIMQESKDAPDVRAVPADGHGPDVGALDRFRAAEYLSVSTRLLDDLLSAGTITRIKIGRKTLIRRNDLDNYLAKLAAEASE